MKAKILIVDDSKVMRGVVKQCLEQAGYGKHTVLEAGSGEEAARMIVSNRPDVLLTDLYMPGMTGMDLLQQVKQKGLPTKVGFITSETHPQLHQTALNEGAVFVLTKPLNAAALKKALSPIVPVSRIRADGLRSTTVEIFRTLLDLEVRRTDVAMSLRHQNVARFTTGCVHLLGGFEGAVIVDCPAVLARQAAARMLRTPPEQVSDDELQDAVGELTNIVAGHLKNNLPGQCRLSLPVVTEGTDYTVRVPNSQLSTEVFLVCDEQPLHVALFERS